MKDVLAARGAGGGPKFRLMVRAIAGLAGLTLCYGLFAGEVSLGEALAAIPAIGSAALFAWLSHRAAEKTLRVALPWRLAPRLGAALALDSLRVGRALLVSLVKPQPGSLIRQNFRHGGTNAAESGRRATVVLAASLAPNGYVVRLPARGNFLLVHRLAPAPLKTDEEWPV